MYLLIRVLEYHWRDRTDVYLGGNMFIYFDPNQQKNRNFRGPDFFVVKGVTDQRPRHSWVIWEEEYRTPEEEKFIEAIEAELFAESESAARRVAEQRAESERQRAEAEAEVARLMALLKGQSSHDSQVD